MSKARAGGASPSGHDGGLSLIETLIALLMLSLVSLVSATFFISALRTTKDQTDKENAIAVATRALEAVQAVPPSLLLSGRSQTAVQALTGSADIAPLVLQDVVASDNFDGSATAASVPVVPLSRTETLAGLTYTARTAINRCFLSRVNRNCTRVAAPDGVPVLRSTVHVTWGPASCGRCRYTVSALVDGLSDPEFSLTISRPVIVSATPSSAVTGQTVTLRIDGGEFESGAVLSLASGGGTLPGSSTRSSDGTVMTRSWTAGSAPGSYTLALTNPDGGRAEYTLVVVAPAASPSPPTAPVANDECLGSPTSGSLYRINPQLNDAPSTGGTLTVLTQPSEGDLDVVIQGGDTYFEYTRRNGARGLGTFTATYRVTVSGLPSNTATVTFRVQDGGCA